jgi:predicted dehydrogenase
MADEAGKVRWGVIGSGGIARRRTIPEGIVPASNAELAAVFDLDARANAAVAEQFGAHACASRRELLEREDVNAAYVATPAHVHHEQVLAAAEAGRHVLCEKPLGLSVEQARGMIEACDRAGVKLGVGFMMRFHACHREALRLIEAGALGKLVYGRAQLSCWYPPIAGAWRQEPSLGGGGAMMDMGGHCIDLLEMLFGPVRRVCCRIGRLVHDYASEDAATALLVFDGGAQGTVDTFFCVPDAASRNRLEIYGSRGSLLAEGTIGQAPGGTMVAQLQEAPKAYDARQARSGSGGLILAPEPVNTYRAEIEDFSGAILEDRPPSNGAELGLRSAAVLAACYESARTGRAVDVRC